MRGDERLPGLGRDTVGTFSGHSREMLRAFAWTNKTNVRQ